MAPNISLPMHLDPGLRSNAAVQISQLKKQLADVQKSLDALEAALQAAPAEKPATLQEQK